MGEYIVDKVFNEVKKLIMEQINDKSTNTNDLFSKVYASTNENIAGYMSSLNFYGKNSALCVMASGDHVFNAAFYGLKNIDTFDINPLTEYYALGIKRSAILAFKYKEYISFMNKLFDKKTSLNELNDLIHLIEPYMDAKFRIFFRNLIDYYNVVQKENNFSVNLFYLLLLDINKIEGYMNNSYLKSEDNYNQLKNALGNVNIVFKKCDCLDLPVSFNDSYDFIFLSNIADYFYLKYGYHWNYSHLLEIEKLFNSLLSDQGVLALNYIYNYFYVNCGKYKENIINLSNIRKNDLSGESIIKFPQVYNNRLENERESGLLIINKEKIIK